MFIWERRFPRRELGGGEVSSSCHFNFLFLNHQSQYFRENTGSSCVGRVLCHHGGVKLINWCLWPCLRRLSTAQKFIICHWLGGLIFGKRPPTRGPLQFNRRGVSVMPETCSTFSAVWYDTCPMRPIGQLMWLPHGLLGLIPCSHPCTGCMQPCSSTQTS